MLAFYLNNQPLLLEEGASLTCEWVNQALEFDSFPGDIGFDITIPYNDVNRTLLGNVESFEKRREGAVSSFYEFRAEYDGFLLISGTLIIYNASVEDGYEGWCRSEVGNIGEEYREKYIADSVSFYKEKKFENKANYDPDTDDYDCPQVYNPDFFSEKGMDIDLEEKIENPNDIPDDWEWDEDESILEEETIPKGETVEDLTAAFYKSAGWKVNVRGEDGKVKVPTDSVEDVMENGVINTETYAITPMLFLSKLIDKVFKDAGFPISNNFIANDDDLKRLLLYNNFTVVHADYIVKTTRYILTPPGVSGEAPNYYVSYGSVNGSEDIDFNTQVSEHSDVISGIVSEVGGIFFDSETSFYYKNLVPKIELSNFLLSVQNLLNVFLFPKRHVKEMEIIDRERIFTESPIDISDYMLGQWKMGEKVNSTLKFTFSHDSNDTYFQDNWESLDDSRDNILEAVDTWDDLEAIEDPELSDIRFVKEANKYAQYKVTTVEEEDATSGQTTSIRTIGWKTVSIGFQNGFFNYGEDDEEEISTEFSTLLGESICITEQKGNTLDEHFEYESFSPRLIFSLGNGEAKYETDTLSLDWEDEEKGLLVKRWKNTARFWCQRQPAERSAQLPINVLDHMLRNIWRRFRSREGVFVVETLRTTFELHRMSATEISGYKVEFAVKTYTLDEYWSLGDELRTDENIDFDNGSVWDFYPLVF